MPEWKPVLGFEGVYEVSDSGLVRSLARRCNLGWCPATRDVRTRLLKPGTHKGYKFVTLMQLGVSRTRLVHRLVLESFVGPCPPGLECRHLRFALESHAAGAHTQAQLSRILRVSRSTIHRIVNGKQRVR